MRHDTRYDDLDHLDNYQLEHSEQDIRGLPLVDANGRKLGIIKDLLVDKSRNRVAAVELEDGRRTAVEPLEIHDNAVVYGAAAEKHAAAAPPLKGEHAEREERIPVIEEQVVIGKRMREGGDHITVRSHVVEDVVREDVAVRDETVSVERRPVNREVSAADAKAAFQDRTVEMVERDEEVVVGKKAVVTDEVVVKKTADTDVKRVEETVRKTEVDVDKTRDTTRR